MKTYVWVDAWQQQCCGGQFGVGSSVNWNVTPEDEVAAWVNTLLGEEWGRKVAFTKTTTTPRMNPPLC